MPIPETKKAVLMRVKCPHCGRTTVPILDICGIDAYQSKTAGPKKLVLEKCVQTSYRRIERDMLSSMGLAIDHSTFHRWVPETDAAKPLPVIRKT